MKSKVIKVILKILSFLICILLFIVLNLYLISYNVNKIVTKDNVTVLASNMSMITILKEKNEEELNALYNIAHQNNIDTVVIDNIINNDEIKKVVANYFGNLVKALLYGGDIEPLSKDKLLLVYSKEFDNTMNNLNYIVTSDQKSLFLEKLDKIVDVIVDSIPSYQELTKNIDATILSSIIYIIIGIAIKSIFDGSCFTNVSPDIVNLFANNIANIILTSGLVTLGLGVIQLIYYRVMKKIKINE